MGFDPKNAMNAAKDIATHAVEAADIVEDAGLALKGDIAGATSAIIEDSVDIATHAVDKAKSVHRKERRRLRISLTGTRRFLTHDHGTAWAARKTGGPTVTGRYPASPAVIWLVAALGVLAGLLLGLVIPVACRTPIPGRRNGCRCRCGIARRRRQRPMTTETQPPSFTILPPRPSESRGPAWPLWMVCGRSLHRGSHFGFRL